MRQSTKRFYTRPASDGGYPRACCTTDQPSWQQRVAKMRKRTLQVLNRAGVPTSRARTARNAAITELHKGQEWFGNLKNSTQILLTRRRTCSRVPYAIVNKLSRQREQERKRWSVLMW